MSTPLNTITISNQSGLDTTKYTVWVAGFIQQMNGSTPTYLALQSTGSFTGTTASFINVNNGLTISVPNVTNYGNNRLVFTITPIAVTPAALSPVTGYTAYPFNNAPGVCPSGPYDIFEFGPNAQYDVSAVDSFGINLSFTVTNDNLVYGAVPTITRQQIGTAFTAFTQADPLGSGFAQLLYTSPATTGYPPLIGSQFSAIVAPKDWLAIYPSATGLSGYWTDTVNSFFAKNNQLSVYLNAATVGTYNGTSDGTKYTLTGPGGLQIIIPASDFAGNQGFVQAVRNINANEPLAEYQAFSQMEAAIFEAFSRGVALDGVVPHGKIITRDHSSNAWVNITNWFSHQPNTYNKKPRVYDVYAKFFHYAKVAVGSNQTNIFGMNLGGTFGMAYGFSLDESPNVSKSWSTTNNNVPAKTTYNVGSGQNVTLVVGPWA